MNTKFRMLEVGETIHENDEVLIGDKWLKTCDGGRSVVNLDLPRRRPVIEVNIHGSSPRSSENSTGKVVTDNTSTTSSGKKIDGAGTVSVDAVPQQYRELNENDIVQEGDEFQMNGVWTLGQQFIDVGIPYRRPVAAEETITEVREAWQKDHMEMKRRLEEALGEKVVAEKERDELLAWQNGVMLVDKQIYAVDQFVRNHPEALIGSGVWETALSWLKERDELRKTLEICQSGNISLLAKSEDLKATVCRLKEKLESVEPFVPTVDGWKRLMAVIPHNNGISVAEGAVRYIQKLEQDLSGVDNHRKALQNSTDHYYQLLVKIGYMFGLRASITDDGLICETVIPEKVPELVAQLIIEHEKTL